MKNNFTFLFFSISCTIILLVQHQQLGTVSATPVQQQSTKLTEYYKSLKPIDIPVHIIYDQNEQIKTEKQKIHYNHQPISKSSGLVQSFAADKSKMAAIRALVEQQLIKNKRDAELGGQKESTIMEVYLKPDGTILNKIEEDIKEKSSNKPEKLDILPSSTEKLMEGKNISESMLDTSNSSLRLSEDHYAQTSILQRAEESQSGSSTPTAETTTTPPGPFASIQQALSNAYEQIRPSNIAQAVINRFTPNRTEEASASNSTQSFASVLEAIRPSNVAQAVINRFSPNRTEDTSSSNATQSFASVFEAIRPSNVAQAVINRFTPNRTDPSTALSSAEGFGNITTTAAPGPLANIQQSFANVFNRLTNRNTTVPTGSTRGEDLSEEIVPELKQAPQEPSFLQTIQSNINSSIENFRQNINNVLGSLNPTRVEGVENSENQSAPPPNFLESFQSTFNNALNNFSTNMNSFLSGINQSQKDNENQQQQQNLWEMFVAQWQAQSQQFQQAMQQGSQSQGTQSDEVQQNNNPWTQIQNNFQQFMNQFNLQSNGTQNDEVQQNNNPWTQIQNNFQQFMNQFNSQSNGTQNDEVQQNNNPWTQLQNNFQQFMNQFSSPTPPTNAQGDEYQSTTSGFNILNQFNQFNPPTQSQNNFPKPPSSFPSTSQFGTSNSSINQNFNNFVGNFSKPPDSSMLQQGGNPSQFIEQINQGIQSAGGGGNGSSSDNNNNINSVVSGFPKPPNSSMLQGGGNPSQFIEQINQGIQMPSGSQLGGNNSNINSVVSGFPKPPESLPSNFSIPSGSNFMEQINQAGNNIRPPQKLDDKISEKSV